MDLGCHRQPPIEAGAPWIRPGGLVIRRWGVIGFLSSAVLVGALVLVTEPPVGCE